MQQPEAKWKLQGNCLGTNPDLFFPPKGSTDIDKPRQICDNCAVETECLEFALANNEKFGVWGGKSEKQRREIKRQRRLLNHPSNA